MSTFGEQQTMTAIQDIARNQLTVRDQFAIAALNAILMGKNTAGLFNNEEEREQAAKLAYKMADAMKKARKD